MREFIAVQVSDMFGEHTRDLKRSLLLFDRIAVIGGWERGLGAGRAVRRVIGPLAEAGILFEISQPIRLAECDLLDDDPEQALRTFAKRAKEDELRLLRVAASELSQTTGADAVAVLGGWTPADSVFQKGKERVVSVVLSRFPHPSSETAWPRIVDYRLDPETRGKYFRLKTWINRAAREDRTAAELVDEINELLYEYQRYMELHRIKCGTGVLRVVLTATAEIIDSLVRLRFAKAVEAVLTLTERQIALSQAELAAPGRELAYLLDASSRFSGGNPAS